MISARMPVEDPLGVDDEEPPSRPSSIEVAVDPRPTSASDPAAHNRLLALAGTALWKDWRWQMQHRIRSMEELRSCFPELEIPTGALQAAEKFPLAITPYYTSLIRALDDSDPIYRMAVPQAAELFDPSFLRDDPLEEEHDMPVPGLVHRYRDRALLLVTSACAMYCRHCTRKRVTGMRESCLSAGHLDQAVAYLREHPEVRDVIVSGGDPLTLSTAALERVLSAVRSVPTVDIIRIGTRTPVTLPMRITDELTRMLREYHPVWVNTHFNHPDEITPAAVEACTRLVDAGVPVGNQTVLLRGVNDDPLVMEQLCRGLVRMRVRPYYLFQCDLVRGVEHFRTPLSRGVQIMEYLRGRLSGVAIPAFVVDAPGGGGKIPVLPNYVVSSSPTHTVLRNFEGMMVSYPEPWSSAQECERRTVLPGAGGPTVFELGTGVPARRPAGESGQRHRHEAVAKPVSALDCDA